MLYCRLLVVTASQRYWHWLFLQETRLALQCMQTADVCNGTSEDEHLERSNMWMVSCVSVCLSVCLWTQLQ
jgi:hypothetical protein